MKLYDELADWWPLMSPPEEYEEEAAFYLRTIVEGAGGPVCSLLELGSGGGNNALHMKAGLEVVLVDPAAGILEVSRRLNPDCEHVQGDMRTVRLGRQFDAVFVHDAIAYMTSEADLRRAIETVHVHTRPGGIALFAPDHVRENFRPATDHGGVDGAGGGRAMRFLEWSWDPDPADDRCTVDYVLVLREEDGSVRVEHDRHVEGLFGRDQWLRLLREGGFDPEIVPFDHSELEPGSYQLFLARRGGATAAR